jgi:hypothetical protein
MLLEQMNIQHPTSNIEHPMRKRVVGTLRDSVLECGAAAPLFGNNSQSARALAHSKNASEQQRHVLYYMLDVGCWMFSSSEGASDGL